MDRINEFLELPNRSVKKLTEKPAQRQLKDSPLSLVRLLTDMKGRPKWTKAVSAYIQPDKVRVERESVYRFFDGQ